MSGVVDSVVLGATLHSANGSVLASTFRQFRADDAINVTVDLNFYYDFDGQQYDLSSKYILGVPLHYVTYSTALQT